MSIVGIPAQLSVPYTEPCSMAQPSEIDLLNAFKLCDLETAQRLIRCRCQTRYFKRG